MPKGKKNKGKFEHRRTEQPYSSDEDAGIDMTIDNCSETSGQSDLKSIHDDAVRPRTNGNKALSRAASACGRVRKRDSIGKVAETLSPLQCRLLLQSTADCETTPLPSDTDDIQEKFEEKVMEVIDALSARSNAARATALVSLRSALQRKLLTGLLCNHRATLADHVTKALRRGRDGERRAAASIAPLLALQIGDEGSEEYVREVRPALTAAVTDKSASVEARTECCSALAVLCYLLEEDLTEIIEVMRLFETVFSGSYLKGDGSVKVTGAAVEEGLLHAAALDGWALLLTVPARAHAAALLAAHPPGFARLADLLQAACLEVRMSAGVALAIAHECVTEPESEEQPPFVSVVVPRLEQLSRDSHKYRAKRDRKLQRATFRDVLKYFEEDEVPSLTIRVGTESVECESWGSRAAYEALAAALGSGLQTLAPHSAPLRAALGLGDAMPLGGPARKLNKLQRHLQNNAACKARTLVRNKNRDKRSAALAL